MGGKVPYGRFVAISYWIRKTRGSQQEEKATRRKECRSEEAVCGLKSARRSVVVNGVGSVWWLISTQVPTWSLPNFGH